MKKRHDEKALYTVCFGSCTFYPGEEQNFASEAIGGKTQKRKNGKMDLGGNGSPNGRKQSIWRGHLTATGPPKRIFRPKRTKHVICKFEKIHIHNS